MMVILAVDYGKARTGLAICDKNMIIATPVGVIEEWNREKLVDKIVQTAVDRKADLIIIGLPKNMDGSEGESAKCTRELKELIESRCDTPVDMHDERCTTMIAHQYLNDVNVRGKKRKQVVDAAAATIILQSYIDGIKFKAGSK